jgi:hypothetical protein
VGHTQELVRQREQKEQVLVGAAPMGLHLLALQQSNYMMYATWKTS